MNSSKFVLTFIFLIAVADSQKHLDNASANAQTTALDMKLNPSSTEQIVTNTKSHNIVAIPPGNIALEKCKEYSNWRKSSERSEPKAAQCRINSPSLVGDLKAKPLEFPHLVHLGVSSPNNASDQVLWGCAGSLISELHVLTPAHCLARRIGKSVNIVKLGQGDVTSVQIRKISRYIIHPSFKAPEKYNDIAILEMDKPVEFSDCVRPACLQLSENISQTTGVVIGWSINESNKQSNEILKVESPFVSHEKCNLTYTANRHLLYGIDDKTMICAGSFFQKEKCQGFGGPLQIPLKNPYCMYSLVGITSFGLRCGSAPDVYTRVSAFVPWIENIVWPTINK